MRAGKVLTHPPSAHPGAALMGSHPTNNIQGVRDLRVLHPCPFPRGWDVPRLAAASPGFPPSGAGGASSIAFPRGWAAGHKPVPALGVSPSIVPNSRATTNSCASVCELRAGGVSLWELNSCTVSFELVEPQTLPAQLFTPSRPSLGFLSEGTEQR